MLAEDTDVVGGGGGGGPITAEEEIPDKEAIDETDDLPIRCAMALLFPSLFFKSCAACRRISAAWPLKTVRCYNMTYMNYDVHLTCNCPCHFLYELI